MRAVINTYYSLTASCVVAFAVSMLVSRDEKDKKFKFNMARRRRYTTSNFLKYRSILTAFICAPRSPSSI